ncbi:hypothetical protein [Streptomyces sp. NPDC058614]|uniref:hypothetical protein n=1 Tax=Streptomyces sp. NPDC058614 TaxID=3346557 RepID=UPI003664D4EB
MTDQTARILTEAANSIEQNVRCQTHAEANGKSNAVEHLRQLAAEARTATGNPSVVTDRVLAEVLAERIRQDATWGEQNHPDGTSCPGDTDSADMARRHCQQAADGGTLAWRHIMTEEWTEARAESDPAKLRAELLQVAAVAVAWVEAIDRRAPAEEQPAVEAPEACARCKKPFDPTDTRFDGRAQHKFTPYCRWCVDLCHDNESADHRCVICDG